MGRSQRHLYQEQGVASDGTGFEAIVGGGEPPPVVLPAPTVTSLTPSSMVEGTASVDVVIAGTGFVDGSIARIGIEPLPTTFTSDTELVATVAFPNYNAGAYFISVLNPDAQVSAAKPFAVTAVVAPAPVLTSISPTTALVGDPPITMTVAGTGFEAASLVQFWGAAVPTVFVSATEMTATITLDGYGASDYPVSVANGEVLSNTILFPVTTPVEDAGTRSKAKVGKRK